MYYNERLKQLRERVGNTQKEMANILKIHKGLYSHYETEDYIMPIKHLNYLCNYFNVSLDYIFNLTDNINYKLYINKDLNKELSGKRLKEFRKENKITQIKLSLLLNTAFSTISSYERGVNSIATSFLYTICKKYNISADYLLGRTNDPKYLK